MVLVAIFFIHDRQRPARRDLLLVRFQHELIRPMLVPTLEHHIIHPRLVPKWKVARAMNARQVIVRIRLLHQRAHLLHPRLVTAQVPLVDHVPPHIRERRETRDTIPVIPLLIRVTHVRLAERIDALVRYVERED